MGLHPHVTVMNPRAEGVGGDLCSWQKPPRCCCYTPPHQHKVRTHLSHTDTRTPRASLVAKRWHGEPMNSSPGEVNYGLGLPRCRTSPSSPQTPYVYKAEMFPGAPSVSVCCAVIFTVNHRFFSGTIFNWEGHGNLMGWCTCCGSENLMPLPGSFIACFHLCSTFDYP